MKLFRDLDEIYIGDIRQTNYGWMCPVCDKTYKRESAAIKHWHKRECHSLVDRLAGLPFERRMFDFYKQFSAEFLSGGPVSLGQFRKNSASYRRIFDFLVLCVDKHIENPYQFAEYQLICSKYLPPYAALSRAKYEYQHFIDFLRREPDLIDSESYYEKHQEELQDDMTACLNALEHANIGLDYLLSKIDLDRLIDGSTRVERERFGEFLDKYRLRS